MARIEQVAWSPEPHDAPSTLVIALHGRGSNETAWASAHTWLPDGVRVAALRGPVELDPGFTWFQNRGIGRPLAESIQDTNAAILAWMDEHADAFERTVLLGFSGGTAMAGGLILSAPERFSAAVLLSGTLPWDAGYEMTAGRLTGLPVFWSIDPEDPMIPRDLVERSEAWLRSASGAVLTERVYPGIGHTICDAERVDIAAFVANLASS